MTNQKKKKLLFIGNSLSDMIKCRGHVMSRVSSEGYLVSLIAPFEGEQSGINIPQTVHWRNWFCRSKSHNPLIEALSFLHLFWLLIKIRPDIVFSYTAKPNLYVSFLRRLFRYRNCCTITGLGRVFTVRIPVYRLFRNVILTSLKSATQVWVMNGFDYRYFKFIKANPSIAYMPGEGVDIEKFVIEKPKALSGINEKESCPLKLLFIGRLLKSKGLEELFEAVKNLSLREVTVSLTVIGPYDAEDADKIDWHSFNELIKKGLINYKGFIADVREFIQQTDCLILPSYREGLPRVILEACSLECPVITTNVSGCRDIISHGINGFLIPPRCSKSIENAIEKFILLSDEKRRELGMQGRKHIRGNYTTTHVQNFYMGALQKLTNS